MMANPCTAYGYHAVQGWAHSICGIIGTSKIDKCKNEYFVQSRQFEIKLHQEKTDKTDTHLLF